MLVKQVGQEGDGLDGLSQSHLIGEDNTIAPEVEEEGKRMVFVLTPSFFQIR